MKKIIIGIALLLLSALLLTGFAFGRKDAAMSEDPYGGVPQSVFYIDGQSVTDLDNPEYHGRTGFFYLDGKTYFGVNVVQARSGSSDFIQNNGVRSYGDYPLIFWGTHNMKTFVKTDDYFEKSGAYHAYQAELGPLRHYYGYTILVFLEIPEIIEFDEAVAMIPELEAAEFFNYAYEPGETEGPSAGDVAEPVTTEPQIYVPAPEGPGAE